MIAIPLPERCLTLLPPWPQAIRYAGKRLENRSRGVAEPLSKWRYSLGLNNAPIIGLSQSNTSSFSEAMLVGNEVEKTHKLDKMELGGSCDWKLTAGTLWLCAELLDVLPPERAAGDPWHVPGQWGLMLGRVWEVKPVTCMGGLGAWRSQWCDVCKKIIADSHGLTCKSCLSTLHGSSTFGPWLDLEVVTEVLT